MLNDVPTARPRAARRRTIRRAAAAGALLLLVGCAGEGASTDAAAADEAAVSAALFELFRERERADGVVLWADREVAGPVMAALAERETDAALVAPPATVPPPLKRDTVTVADIEAVFRAAPDGWGAFRDRWPWFAGLVEVGPVRRPDDSTATVLVGRNCGEHCRSAWRVTLSTTDSAPRVREVVLVPVPADR